jgi:hypothetical protein
MVAHAVLQSSVFVIMGMSLLMAACFFCFNLGCYYLLLRSTCPVAEQKYMIDKYEMKECSLNILQQPFNIQVLGNSAIQVVQDIIVHIQTAEEATPIVFSNDASKWPNGAICDAQTLAALWQEQKELFSKSQTPSHLVLIVDLNAKAVVYDLLQNGAYYGTSIILTDMVMAEHASSVLDYLIITEGAVVSADVQNLYATLRGTSRITKEVDSDTVIVIDVGAENDEDVFQKYHIITSLPACESY